MQLNTENREIYLRTYNKKFFPLKCDFLDSRQTKITEKCTTEKKHLFTLAFSFYRINHYRLLWKFQAQNYTQQIKLFQLLLHASRSRSEKIGKTSTTCTYSIRILATVINIDDSFFQDQTTYVKHFDKQNSIHVIFH